MREPLTPAGAALRRWRIALGLTQADLAARLDVDRASVQAWEAGLWRNGKPAPLPVHIRLACAALAAGLEPISAE